MTNRKGPDFERVIADYLRDRWSEFIDRRVKTGVKDKGDIANFRVGKHRVVVECKNLKFGTDGQPQNIPASIKEMQQEVINDEALTGILVQKRKGKAAPEEQYAIMLLGDLLTLLDAALSEGTAI